MLALPQSVKANTAFGSAPMASTIRSNFPSEAFCYLSARLRTFASVPVICIPGMAPEDHEIGAFRPLGATNKAKPSHEAIFVPGQKSMAGRRVAGFAVMDQLYRYWTWLEYDRTALAVLVTGIGIVLMLAVSICASRLNHLDCRVQVLEFDAWVEVVKCQLALVC